MEDITTYRFRVDFLFLLSLRHSAAVVNDHMLANI